MSRDVIRFILFGTALGVLVAAARQGGLPLPIAIVLWLVVVVCRNDRP